MTLINGSVRPHDGPDKAVECGWVGREWPGSDLQIPPRGAESVMPVMAAAGPVAGRLVASRRGASRSGRVCRHPRVVAPSLYLPKLPAASILQALRLCGPLCRDVIASATSNSSTTVARQVNALLEIGLLQERGDLAVAGAIGRPRVPVGINHEPFLTLGMYVGARTTHIVASDLLGRTLDCAELMTPLSSPSAALASLAYSAAQYLKRWRRRRPLWAGVAINAAVDTSTGRVDHPELGWRRAPLGPMLADALGLPVSVASHVDAMAAAELVLGARPCAPRSQTGLYFYAGETVGYALVIGDRVHCPAAGPGNLSSLPVNSQLLGGTGQLESTVADEAVLAAARRQRLLPAIAPGDRTRGCTAAMTELRRLALGGNQAARHLFAERVRVLGEAIALVRDLLNPDELVVGGHTLTECPETMQQLQAALAARSVLPPLDIRATVFGNRAQEAGAKILSLSALYADPVDAMRRTQKR
jgi:predicted NBD/HSP70 family sugar kinase